MYFKSIGWLVYLLTLLVGTHLPLSQSPESVEKSIKPINTWKYRTSKDRKTSSTTKSAEIISDDEESSIILSINSKYGTDIIIFIDPAKNEVNHITGDSIGVKFDDKPEQRFKLITSKSKFGNNMAFVGEESKFISQLKKSKRTMIKLNLVQSYPDNTTEIVYNVFIFNSSNLNW